MVLTYISRRVERVVGNIRNVFRRNPSQPCRTSSISSFELVEFQNSDAIEVSLNTFWRYNLIPVLLQVNLLLSETQQYCQAIQHEDVSLYADLRLPLPYNLAGKNLRATF